MAQPLTNSLITTAVSLISYTSSPPSLLPATYVNIPLLTEADAVDGQEFYPDEATADSSEHVSTPVSTGWFVYDIPADCTVVPHWSQFLSLHVAREDKSKGLLSLEERSLVSAIRDTLVPRLSDGDRSIFTTIMHDVFPDVDVPLDFIAPSDSSSGQEVHVTVVTYYATLKAATLHSSSSFLPQI